MIPGDFSFSFDSIDATSPEEVHLTGVHWQYGRLGAGKGVYPNNFTSVGVGSGVLQAERGSPLAEPIGTDPVLAPGLFLRFHFTGTVELADI